MNRPHLLKPLETIEGATNSAFASLYKLCWALSGPVKRRANNGISTKSNRVTVTNAELIEKKMKDMYEQDFKDSHVIKKELSQDDKKWEKLCLIT